MLKRPRQQSSSKSLILPLYSIIVTVLLLHKTLQTPAQQQGTSAHVKGQTCEPCPKPGSDGQDAAGLVAASTVIPGPPINLLEVLGPENGLSSVSGVAYMAYTCVSPINLSLLKGAASDVVQQKRKELESALVRIVQDVRGPGAAVSPQQTLLQALGVGAGAVNHPHFLEARRRIAELLGRGYTFTPEPPTKQCCAKKGQPATLEDLGSEEGAEGCGVECIGFPTAGWMLGTIERMADSVITQGLCTDPPVYTEGYANEMIKRMSDKDWKWFNVETLSEDAIIFLFQLLYEHHTVFLRQHWLGVVAMQNPFDAWTINDIIYTVKPDLIIEAGTANGGSALMWASMLHLIGKGGRVVTLDLDRPENIGWAVKRENPWDHKLWGDYVTFIQGSSTEDAIYNQVKALADNATSVLVLLDSSHEEHHVTKEMALYCPLASLNSYCITQDTKMGRFNWQGPMEAVMGFLKQHPEFQSDRSRELLFTDHPRGYLKRVA